MTIAIIDQGINFQYTNLKSFNIEEKNIYEDDEEIYLENCAEELLIHGTNIASIICNEIADVKILSLRLIPKRKINVKLLCQALEYCLELDEIRLISISLGIVQVNCNPELLSICKKIHNQGKIINAAAHPNSTMKCYPAAFPFVFGVGSGFIYDKQEYTYMGKGYINVLAKGVYQRVFGENGNKTMGTGTSYATAYFTAILAKILFQENSISRKKLIENLKVDSQEFLSFHYPITTKKLDSCCSHFKRDYNLRYMLFGTDDLSILKFLQDDNRLEIIMNYPVDSDIRDTYRNVLSLNYKVINGQISQKFFDFIDTLVIGNFMKNPIQTNICFGFILIDFFVKNNSNLLLIDEYIYNDVIPKIISKYPNYSGKIYYQPFD